MSTSTASAPLSAAPSPDQPLHVMFSAGEASGDAHAAAVFRAMQHDIAHLRANGMGGKASQNAGIELIVDSSDLGVVGLGEVLRHFGSLRRALKTMQQAVCSQRPDLLICVDYKEFNLKLARHAKACGVKVLFYVSPQVWAWRPGRVKKYGQAIDMMAVIFPFETAFYEAHSIPVRYVGHPLVGRVQASQPREVLLREFALDGSKPIVGLLPGSRRMEVLRLLPVMLQAARILQTRHPGVQFILPQASTIDGSLVGDLLAKHPDVHVTRVQQRSYDALACCDAAMVASGTATLETALMQVPMVVAYKVSPLTYTLLKPLIRIPDIALVNIVAGQRIVPELVQHQACGEAMADEISRLLNDTSYAQAMRQALCEVEQRLGTQNGVQSMANLAKTMLHNSALP